MIKRILVCIDGSVPYTESVCQDAIWMAQRTQASLAVLYVSDIRQFEISMVTDFSGSLGVQPYQNLYTQLQEMEREKARIIQQQIEEIFLPIRDRVTFYQRTGIMVDILHEFESSEMGVDMVILGKRGENVNFATEHLGSTMERVVRASIKPCFVSSRDHRDIKQVLIAYDASPSVHKAVQFLVRSEDFRDLEIHLLSAVHDLENNEMRSHIQRTESILHNAGYKAHHKIVNGDPEDVVAEYIERHGIHMLVMGAYGHSTIRHLLIGSTTTNLVRRCHIPTLMFR